MANDTREHSDGVTRSGIKTWVHICERCGEQMEEIKCKILCRNCGMTRDCSDP